jgi:hydrogenase 3 maturation protease
VAVLALGSRLRADDAAGLLAAERLRAALRRRRGKRRARVFLGETAPENLTGVIKRYKPTHLVVIDAAEMGLKAGHIHLVDSQTPHFNAALSTHNLPIGVLTDYLQRSTGCEVLVLGLQPVSCAFGGEVSPAVLKASERLADLLAAALA